MENYISEQLSTLAASLLLGALGAWLYDVLRAVRIRHRQDRLLTHLVDGAYAVMWLLVLLGFALHRGGGELRLYMIVGAGLGVAGYFGLLSRRLRPLWDFWAETGAVFGNLLLYPLHCLAVWAKKIAAFLKKCFQFAEKYATIKKYKWEFTCVRNQGVRRGGRISREQQKKRKKEP